MYLRFGFSSYGDESYAALIFSAYPLLQPRGKTMPKIVPKIPPIQQYF